jgi:hypothetical protein
MNHAIRNAQLKMNAALKDYLSENGEILSEILLAYADIKAMAALSRLRGSAPQPHRCQEAQVVLVRDSLAQVHGAEGSTRPDFDAAVRWHGARLDEVLERSE